MNAIQRRQLTLIIPGLFGPAPPEGADAEAALEALVSGLDLSAVETLFSRARVRPAVESWESPEDLLFSAFGYRRPAGDWPAAALTRWADTDGGTNGWWLRADPVHLKADMGDLVLFDGDHFALDLEEAKALAKIVADHFRDAGWRLELTHPLRWHLGLDAPARIESTPLSMARLRSVDANLPAGEEAGRWHGLLNEAQMVLHDCAVNRSREARGEVSVNSLWFWGGGELPPAPAARWSEACGDSALLRGLAKRAAISWRALPEGADAWLKAGPGGARLAFIDAGHALARSSDLEKWREFIESLSAAWFGPLLRAVNSGEIESVTVLTDRKVRYDAGRARWWQRFEKRRPFFKLADPGVPSHK